MAAAEWLASSRALVNKLTRDAAAGYGAVNLNASYAFTRGSGDVSLFARVDRVFNKVYVGSPIVNQGNSRLFEPALQRIWLAGNSVRMRF